VLLDGVPVHACLTLAHKAQGRAVETIESLETEGRLAAIQRGFNEKLGAQCGFCTPGMIMAAEGLLRQNPDPSPDDIREGLGANICRCTGYIKIIEAVQFAANEINGATEKAA
jgi:4-hydroxybenzoyl-CoA reductase subunit gamma